MQGEQKELIRRYWSQLMLLTEVQSLAKTLINKTIFTQLEVNNIFSTHDERYNKTRFFNEFQDKNEAAFDCLVQWLNSTGQTRLARKLAAKSSGTTPFKAPEEEDDEEDDEFTSSIEAESPLTFTNGNTLPITFDESKTPLKVEVRLANEFHDTKDRNPNVPFYKCRSKSRGRVLIINNYAFANQKPRAGAEVDEANLKELFEQMGGWDVKSKSNQTAEEMRSSLRSFAKEKKDKRCDVCFVFIMSHGTEELNTTIISGIDDKYLKVEDIQGYFTNDKCALYRGKPKVFIYQVCRGFSTDVPHTYITQFDGKCKPLVQTTATNKPLVSYCRPVDDMLVGYATMQGTKAHRDPYRGTWYIELICKHFMELARYESVDDILVTVDAGLRRRMSDMGTVQTAEHISKGFKKLYLNPGVFEENGRLVKFHPDPIG